MLSPLSSSDAALNSYGREEEKKRAGKGMNEKGRKMRAWEVGFLFGVLSAASWRVS